MPTNQQRRATAKRKLQRQLERRAQRARKRRMWTIAGLSALVAVVVAAVAVGFVTKWNFGVKSSATSASSASSAGAAPSSSAPDTPPPPGVGVLPAFHPPADLGANCQYPASPQPAARKVDPPHSGKVPTDPKQVSVSMKTNQGNVGIQLDNEKSPCTVNSFISLASDKNKFFANTPCHRLVLGDTAGLLQCGDPTGSGSGGPGYQFPNEYPTNQYKPDEQALQQAVIYPRGTLAMANAGPGTNGSQFFMVFKDTELPPQYTVFGTIDQTGLETLDKIATAGLAPGSERQPGDGKPKLDVTIISVQTD